MSALSALRETGKLVSNTVAIYQDIYRFTTSTCRPWFLQRRSTVAESPWNIFAQDDTRLWKLLLIFDPCIRGGEGILDPASRVLIIVSLDFAHNMKRPEFVSPNWSQSLLRIAPSQPYTSTLKSARALVRGLPAKQRCSKSCHGGLLSAKQDQT